VDEQTGMVCNLVDLDAFVHSMFWNGTIIRI